MKVFDEDGNELGLKEMIEWWLHHYEGMEHLTEGGNTSPETWFTINVIFRRSLEKIRNSQLKRKNGIK